MKKDLNGYDILNDYEGLCGQLLDVVDVLEFAELENEVNLYRTLGTTARLALKQLIREHRELADKYREELKQ